MTITRAQFPLLLEPKLRNIWNEGWPKRPLEYTRFLNIGSSKKAQETDYKMTGLGAVANIAEGAEVTFGDPISGGTKVYTHTQSGLAYKITDMMIRHELYGQMQRMESSLMDATQDRQETDGASIILNAFATTAANSTGFQSGESLCATSHARLDGGTAQSNRPATDVSLGVAALQNAIIQYHNWKNDRGRPFLSVPKLLVVQPADIMTARELLGSEYKPGTTNNEINAIKEDGLTYMVSHYLGTATTTLWALLGDNHDLNLIWDLRPTTTMDTEFKTDNVLRKVKQSYSFGWGEWRGIYGSLGV